MDTRINLSAGDVSTTPLLATAFGMSKHLRALLGLRLAEIGIAVGQDHLLALMEPVGKVNVGVLATALCVRPSTVSKMANLMIRAGWIEREADERDTRRTSVQLTPLGGHVRGQVLEIWAEIEADLHRHLPDPADVERQMRAVDDRLTSVLSRLR